MNWISSGNDPNVNVLFGFLPSAPLIFSTHSSDVTSSTSVDSEDDNHQTYASTSATADVPWFTVLASRLTLALAGLPSAGDAVVLHHV